MDAPRAARHALAPMLRLLVAVHVLAALAASRTFFQPDEYWQSLEIAHRWVFGYGYRTWEWTAAPIRSAVYPATLVPLYAALRAVRADTIPWVMVRRCVAANAGNGAYAAAGAALCRRRRMRVYGHPAVCLGAGRCALGRSGAHRLTQAVLHLSSPYWLYTAPRTFSNSAEAALTSAALALWPLSPHAARALDQPRVRRAYRGALLAAWVAVLVRPTSLVPWAFLGAALLAQARRQRAVAVGDALWIGAAVLGAGVVLDSWYYGRPTCVALAFVRENLWDSVSAFYGANAWHWYVTQGLPAIAAALTPWVALGWCRLYAGAPDAADPAALRAIAQLCAWTVAVYSLLRHKEVRFLQPLVPWLHLCAAVALAPHSNRASGAAPPLAHAWSSLPRYVRALLLLQVPVTIYVSAFHAHAQVHVMSYLQRLGQTPAAPASVGFLMPCHSTPWQSHMHTPALEAAGDSGDAGLAWFLACPPPRGIDAAHYRDQTDVFFSDPVHYLETRFPPHVDPRFPPMRQRDFQPSGAPNDLGWRHPWPSHLVLFASLLERRAHARTVRDVLAARGYVEQKRLWNALAHPDAERRGDVVVWAWRPPTP